MGKYIKPSSNPFTHPSVESTTDEFDRLAEFISQKVPATTWGKDQAIDEDVATGTKPKWKADSELIAQYVDADTIPTADLVEILRKSRQMALDLKQRATDFSDVFRPTEPITIDMPDGPMTITPEMYDCYLKKAFKSDMPAETPEERLKAHQEMADTAAKDIVADAENLKKLTTFNFGLIFLKMLLRIVLKFILSVIMKPICTILKTIGLAGALDNAFYKAIKIRPCNMPFSLEEEMAAEPVRKALTPPFEDPGENWLNYGPEMYQDNIEECSDIDIRNTTPAEQENAQAIVAAVVATESKDTNSLETIDDVLRYRDEFSSLAADGTPRTDLGEKKIHPSGWSEMTIAQRINAEATSTIMSFDRIEHRLVPPDGAIPEGDVKTEIYSFIMNLSMGLKAADQALSGFTHLNLKTPKGPFGNVAFICCAIRVLFTILVVNNKNPITGDKLQEISENEQIEVLRMTERGIGYFVENNNVFGEDSLKKLQVFAALFDAILGRLLGSVSMSAKVTKIMDYLKQSIKSAFDEMKNMGVEALSLLTSTVVDVVDLYIKDLYVSAPTLRESIALCEPIEKMFGMMTCGIKGLKFKAFFGLADQWKRTNTEAAMFEFLYDLKMQHRTVTFFSDLINFTFKADVTIRNICGLSNTMSDLERAHTLEEIKKQLGTEDILDKANTVPESDRAQYLADLRSKIDSIQTPIYDPEVRLGPKPGYIDGGMFVTDWGGDAFAFTTSYIYRVDEKLPDEDKEPPKFGSPELNEAITNCTADFGNWLRIIGGEVTTVKDRLGLL